MILDLEGLNPDKTFSMEATQKKFEENGFKGWLPIIGHLVDSLNDSSMFELARNLKGRVNAEGRNLNSATWLPLVKFFCRSCYRVYGHGPVSGPGSDDDWNDYDDSDLAMVWDDIYTSVKYGVDEDVLKSAYRQSKGSMDAREHLGLSTCESLIYGIALHIQYKPVLLPQDKLSTVTGYNQSMISRAIRRLVLRDYLQVLSKGSQASGKASSYRVNGFEPPKRRGRPPKSAS